MLKILSVVFILGVFYENAEGVCNVRCKSIGTVAAGCLKHGKAFLPPDGRFNCCGSCKKVKDVISSKYLHKCNPDRCATIKCTPDNVNNCEDGFVYVPADCKCFCCDKCTRRSKWH